MNKRWLTGLGLLPLIAGCSILATDPVPPRPAVTGVGAQDVAWQNQVKRPRNGGEARFEPLIAARDALDKAHAQPEVQNHDQASLSEAEAAFETAESAWAEIADKQHPAPDQLAEVANAAHRAQRLAEVARFTALREINLEQLMAADDKLKARRESVAGNAGASVPVSGAARELVGQKVIPDRLGDVSFEGGTARIKDASQAVVGQLAQMLRDNPSVGVAIFGHTDNVAPSQASMDRFVNANPKLKDQSPSRSEKIKAFNLALSAARARVVAKLLVDNGVPARRIGARGFGDTRPIASNDTSAGRRKNRRVEAVIVPGPDSPAARRARAKRN